MQKLFYIFALMLVSPFARAVSNPAGFVCRGMDSEGQQRFCEGMINGRNFSFDALRLCDKMSNDYERLKCLRFSSNRQFERNALALCGVLKGDMMVNSCIDTIADGTFKSHDLEKCDAQGLSMEKIHCLKLAKGSKTF